MKLTIEIETIEDFAKLGTGLLSTVSDLIRKLPGRPTVAIIVPPQADSWLVHTKSDCESNIPHLW